MTGAPGAIDGPGAIGGPGVVDGPGVIEGPGGPVPPVASALPRRRLLALAASGLGACAAGGALGVVGAAVVGTPLRAGASSGTWVDLGPVARFPEGALRVVAIGEQRDAWNRYPARSLGNVVVVRRGEALTALSAACPHNGCDVTVRTRPDGADLFCPCHDSAFTLGGDVTGGPSPRGLDPLESRVADGRLLVRWQRFQVGTPERRPS